jgi:acetaldehyde dehydrogenase (acetylating)
MKKFKKFDRNGNPIDDDDEVLRDGQTLRVSHMFIDGNSDEFAKGVKLAKATAHDGFGRVAGFKPGFAYGDEASRELAHTAYEERSKHLNNAWRKDAVTTDDKRPTNLKDAQAAAAHAYEERNQRLQNAWRDRNEHHSSKGAT